MKKFTQSLKVRSYELEITLEGISFGRTSATFKQEIFNIKTGKKIVGAELAVVFINQEGKPIPIDEESKKSIFPWVMIKKYLSFSFFILYYY